MDLPEDVDLQVHLSVYIFQPSEEGALEAEAGEDESSPYSEWQLPAKCFCGLWESLLYGQVHSSTPATTYSSFDVYRHTIDIPRIAPALSNPT